MYNDWEEIKAAEQYLSDQAFFFKFKETRDKVSSVLNLGVSTLKSKGTFIALVLFVFYLFCFLVEPRTLQHSFIGLSMFSIELQIFVSYFH